MLTLLTSLLPTCSTNSPVAHLLGSPLVFGICIWGRDELSMGLVNTPLQKNPKKQLSTQVRVWGDERGMGEGMMYCHLPDDVAGGSLGVRGPAKGQDVVSKPARRGASGGVWVMRRLH